MQQRGERTTARALHTGSIRACSKPYGGTQHERTLRRLPTWVDGKQRCGPVRHQERRALQQQGEASMLFQLRSPFLAAAAALPVLSQLPVLSPWRIGNVSGA